MATAEQELQQQQQDTERLHLLPPLKYETMTTNERLAFIQWYQQTQEGMELFGRYPQDALKGIVDAYPTEEPVDDRLKESFAESFESYVQQKWSLDGKRPPQPASYFLFHKRFSETDSTSISLVIPNTGMAPTQVFNLQELNQIYDQGIPTIVTAVGSKQLHFHELGTVQSIGSYDAWCICMEQNHQYIFSAIAEFTEQKTTEVWFRRERNGTPQFIFCPSDSAKLLALSLPLKETGQPGGAVLELSRLEAMPPLVPERFSADHKDGFYRWLLATNKFHIEDDDPESLQFAPLLFGLCSNDFHVCDPKIPEAAGLYEEYVSEKWRVPHKQPPFPSYVYLFKNGVQPTDLFWIWLPQELMQRASSLILNTAELDQLSNLNRVPVCISIDSGDASKYFAVAGLLENVGTHCGFSFSNDYYRETFRGLKKGKYLELWFSRSEDKKPHFIIRPRNKW